MRQLKNGVQLALSPLDQVKRVVPASAARTKAAAGALQHHAGSETAGRQPQQQQQHGAKVLGQVELAERLQQLQVAVQQDATLLGSRGSPQQLQAVRALQAQQVSPTGN
jgi:hypothetical protein